MMNEIWGRPLHIGDMILMNLDVYAKSSYGIVKDESTVYSFKHNWKADKFELTEVRCGNVVKVENPTENELLLYNELQKQIAIYNTEKIRQLSKDYKNTLLPGTLIKRRMRDNQEMYMVYLGCGAKIKRYIGGSLKDTSNRTKGELFLELPNFSEQKNVVLRDLDVNLPLLNQYSAINVKVLSNYKNLLKVSEIIDTEINITGLDENNSYLDKVIRRSKNGSYTTLVVLYYD